MSIKISCDACGKELKVRDEAAGKKVKCPDCTNVIQIPIPDDVMDAEVDDDNPFAGGGIKSSGATADDEDRKPCRACGEMILANAKKCRYCGEVFDKALKKKKSSGNRRKSSRSCPVADPGKRLTGKLADGLAALVLIGPGIGCFFSGNPDGPNENQTLLAIGVILVLLGLLAWFGLNLYLFISNSQSIGKYLVNTQIFDYETDEPAGFVKSWLLRSFVNWILCNIPLYGLIDVLFVFSEDHRCLHDRLAGTYVVDIS